MGKIFEKTEQIDLFGESEQEQVDNSLNARYIVPPFSVLDTKQGYWQNRKRQWLKLGIKSELGRNATTFNMKDWADKKRELGMISGNTMPSDTSIFDPVLCELMYKWFNVDNGTIYDPFAGGSVRGIVAEKLGYKYNGIDLSENQVKANYENAKEIGVYPTWYNDDSMNCDKYIKDNSMDMIFSCPPYFDLEIYSDKVNDLSKQLDEINGRLDDLENNATINDNDDELNAKLTEFNNRIVALEDSEKVTQIADIKQSLKDLFTKVLKALED